MLRIICAGSGGQGILTTGQLLATISVEKGKLCTFVPSYGSEMRGGTASCRIKISETEILNPFFTELDLLIGMTTSAMEHFAKDVSVSGIIVADSSSIEESYTYPAHVRLVALPATQWAIDMNNARGANLVMLGAAVGATRLFEAKEFANDIDAYFLGKGKINPLNRDCFLKGYETATGQRGNA